MQSRGRATRAITILTQAFLLAGAAVSSVAALTEREQNRQESDYSQIARGAGLPQFCARIYPEATGGAGFNAAGFRTWYAQSRCYYDVAVRTGDARLCDKVRTRLTLLLDGRGISAAACRKEVASAAGAPGARATGPRIDFIVNAKPILEKMGYTEASIPRQFLSAANEIDMWQQFLNSIADTPDFLGRIERLPDFTRVATGVNTTTCDPPFILGDVAPGSRYERDCCIDVNHDGTCDEVEFKGSPVRASDLVLVSTAGRPPVSLCGDRDFDIEIAIRNRGAAPVRPESGYLFLVPVNPAAFGLRAIDFYRPLPAIPPGGSATVRFAHLRYRDGLEGRGNGMPLQAMVCLPGESNDCGEALRLSFERRAPDAPECAAGRALRRASGPCGPPHIHDREAGGAGCCLDVDRDARCDDREWEESHVRPDAVRVQFPKDDPSALVFEEGVPTVVRLTVRNNGPVALGRHDGLIELTLPPRVPVTAAGSGLRQPLPEVAPGQEAVVAFRGLRFEPDATTLPVQGGALSANLCMVGGCVQADWMLGSFRIKDADRVLAERRSGVRASPAPRNGRRIPRPIIGSDGSLTRSTLDPQAWVEPDMPAPDFSLLTAGGDFFRLIQLREKKNVLLVFCPEPASAGCRARLNSLEASSAELARLDVQVFVLSDGAGAVPADGRLRPRHGFSWLRDPGLRVSSCYARRAGGEEAKPRPMLVLVDKQGKTRRIVDDDRGTQPPIGELLRAIRQSAAPQPAASPGG